MEGWQVGVQRWLICNEICVQKGFSERPIAWFVIQSLLPLDLGVHDAMGYILII